MWVGEEGVVDSTMDGEEAAGSTLIEEEGGGNEQPSQLLATFHVPPVHWICFPFFCEKKLSLYREI